MAKPPNFTGTSHEDMKRLLKAEDDRRRAKGEWAFQFQFWATVLLVLIVLALIGRAFLGVFR